MLNNPCNAFTSLQPFPTARTGLSSTFLSSHAIGREKTVHNCDAAAANGIPIQAGEAGQGSIEEHHSKTSNHPVDFALLGGMACLTALATMAWISTDSSFIQNIEDDGSAASAATLIVDGVLGAVAATVSLVSVDE